MPQKLNKYNKAIGGTKKETKGDKAEPEMNTKGENNGNEIAKIENKYAQIINFINPLIVVFFFSLFIIFTIVVLIINNKDEIKWYSNYYIFITWLFLILLFLPYIFTLLNGIWSAIQKFKEKKNNSNDQQKKADCPNENLNTNFFWIIINGLKFCLLNSINTIITFLCIAAIYTIVEDTHVIKNLMGFITFIIIFLIVLFAYTMLFKIESSKQQILMALIILLVTLKIIFEPLFWLLTKAIDWGKSSKNTFITILLLFIFSIVVFAINYIIFKLQRVENRVNKVVNDVEKEVTNWGTGKIAAFLKDIANAFLNVLGVVKLAIPEAPCNEEKPPEEPPAEPPNEPAEGGIQTVGGKQSKSKKKI